MITVWRAANPLTEQDKKDKEHQHQPTGGFVDKKMLRWWTRRNPTEKTRKKLTTSYDFLYFCKKCSEFHCQCCRKYYSNLPPRGRSTRDGWRVGMGPGRQWEDCLEKKIDPSKVAMTKPRQLSSRLSASGPVVRVKAPELSSIKKHMYSQRHLAAYKRASEAALSVGSIEPAVDKVCYLL